MATAIRVPYQFAPRNYQLPFLKAIDNGIDRLIIVWPRRHGKDKTCLNGLTKKMLERPGNYYYIFPEYNQGRKALWDNLDSDGFRTIDHIPKEIRKKKNDTEMKIELVNGSIFQVVGAADIDRIVGTNPAGVVFSEYSLIDPMVWGYIYPILAENGGFAWFNLTPRGDNHARKLVEKNKNRKDWFVDHINALEAGVFSKKKLEEIKRDYFELYGDYTLYDQEFMTSFESPVMGSYYGKHMRDAENEGRITSVPYDASVPVHTWWDIGIGDSTAVWFFQEVGQEYHFIDYYENSGESLQHYAQHLKEKPYTYGEHYGPHDLQARELGTGKTREEVARNFGINFRIVKRQAIDDGINAARTILPKCWFDETKCEQGIAALKNYHREFDDKNKVFKDRPHHDWSSHGADAFRTGAMGYRPLDDSNFPEEDLFNEGFYL